MDHCGGSILLTKISLGFSSSQDHHLSNIPALLISLRWTGPLWLQACHVIKERSVREDILVVKSREISKWFPCFHCLSNRFGSHVMFIFYLGGLWLTLMNPRKRGHWWTGLFGMHCIAFLSLLSFFFKHCIDRNVKISNSNKGINLCYAQAQLGNGLGFSLVYIIWTHW